MSGVFAVAISMAAIVRIYHPPTTPMHPFTANFAAAADGDGDMIPDAPSVTARSDVRRFWPAVSVCVSSTRRGRGIAGEAAGRLSARMPIIL